MQKKFHVQPLLQQATVGELLKRTRDQQKISIETSARKLTISEKYLVALEQGRYNDLPSPVYIKNYVKRYSGYLGLPWKQVERLYEQEIKVYYDTPIKPSKRRLQSITKQHNTASAHHQKALLIPRALKIGLIGVFILSLATYFTWGVVRFLSPPTLVVTQPESDVIVTDHRYTVQGKSEAGSILTINGEETNLDPTGAFSEKLILHEGLNTLRIASKTPRSRERVVTRYIIYEPPIQKEKVKGKNT